MATETVEYCPICRTKTWHVDGVCEWSDGHEKMEQERQRQAVPYVDTCIEHAYGTTTRLSFQIRVF